MSASGKLDELLFGSHQKVHGRNRHEDQSDGEQHLLKVALAVDMHVEAALDDHPQSGAEEERERQRRQEGDPKPIDQPDGHIAARHGEGPMGEIDEIHQPEGDRQSATKDEQQHAVRNAVEQDSQHAEPAQRISG